MRRNQAARLEEQKGGLGEGPAEGLSRDSMLGVPAPHRGCRSPEDPPSPLHSHQDPESEAEPQPEPEPAGKWVLCNYDFQARNSSELSVKHRDVLEVLDDKRKWWKVRDQWEQEGYVPYNILTPHPGPRVGRSQSPAGILPRTWPPLLPRLRPTGTAVTASTT